MYHAVPDRPAEPLPQAFPTDNDYEMAADEIFCRFCETNEDPYGLEELVQEYIVPQLVISLRSCQGHGDGGYEMNDGRELFRKAAVIRVAGFDADAWEQWRRRRS